MTDDQTVLSDSNKIPSYTPPPAPMEPGVPPEPPKKSNKTLWIIIIVVVLLLCCCVIVIGVAAWQYGDQIFQQLGVGSLLNLLI